MRYFRLTIILLLTLLPLVGVNAEETEVKSRSQEVEEKRNKLKAVQKKLGIYEKQVDILEGKEVTINDILEQLDIEIGQIEEAVENSEKSLMETQQSITDKEHEILLKEEDIRGQKKYLAEYVRTLNTLDKKTMIEVLLEKSRLSDYFKEIEAVFTFQKKLGEILENLEDSKLELAEEKEELKEIEVKQMSLHSMQLQQRIVLNERKAQKKELLSQTKDQQQQFGELIEKGSEVASKLASELTALQSLGTEINFETAAGIARKVEGLTGVRAPFLLGVLKVESNMGNNVGGGRYKTDMNPSQWSIFKDICEELGYDAKEVPVSRKPCYKDSKGNCGGWGGAMGPAQFIPSTWIGYKKQVEKVTGREPADPWNLEDALTAMGIKLAKVGGVTEHKESAERQAACMYLAGGNWQSFSWYGDRVLGYAAGYEKVLKDNGN